MSIRVSRNLFMAANIFAIFIGVVSCISIFLIPLGVFLFIASSKFRELSKLDDVDLERNIKETKYFGWAIFMVIVSFPFGVVAILPYFFDITKE